MSDEQFAEPGPLRSLPMTQSVADAYLAGTRSKPDEVNPHPDGTDENHAWTDGHVALRRRLKDPTAPNPREWVQSGSVIIAKPANDDDQHNVLASINRQQFFLFTPKRARAFGNALLTAAAEADNRNRFARQPKE